LRENQKHIDYEKMRKVQEDEELLDEAAIVPFATLKPLLIVPEYKNIVKTGHYWNGYNRTHYDFENPPPK
jgi:hypothetical protein